MRILFLTTQLPYPPESGGVIKSWNLVQHWAKKYQVTLVHPLKEGEEEYLDEFSSRVELVAHHHVPVHRTRSGWNLLRSYLGHASLNIFRNYHPEITSIVRSECRKADILFVDHYEMGQFIPSHASARVILHEHNAEFVLWKRLAELESNPLKKALLKLEAKRILKAEKRYAQNSDQVWAAPNDIEELTDEGVDRSKMVKTYHLGEDRLLHCPVLDFERTTKSLLYIGTLSWEANIDGLLWFLDTCWPKIQAENKGVTFTIVGKNPDQRIKRAVEKHTGVSFAGFIADLEECFPVHRVFIVPQRFGSGIKVKILNSLYRGIPTVSTTIGTEGLDVEHGVHMFECADEKEFIASVTLLLNDRSVWERIRDNSRELGCSYTWARLLQDHDAQLDSLLLRQR